jgi:hypothetical protein
VIVAGVVIETASGASPRVAARLLREREIALHGGDGARLIAAVFTGADGEALEAFADRLVREDAEVLGVFPTYVGEAPEGEDERASPTSAAASPGDR